MPLTAVLLAGAAHLDPTKPVLAMWVALLVAALAMNQVLVD